MVKKADSKQVLVVLLIITIVVSVAGTWLMLDSLSGVSTKPAPSSETGKLKVFVGKLGGGVREPVSKSTDGNVQLTVGRVT